MNTAAPISAQRPAPVPELTASEVTSTVTATTGPGWQDSASPAAARHCRAVGAYAGRSVVSTR